MDIKEELINLILSEWNASATNYNQVPEVTSGWMDNDLFDTPTIQLVNFSENPLGGGETGYTGIQGNGRPMQRMSVSGSAICTTHERMEGIGGNPQYVCTQMKNEMRRLVNDNYLDPFGDVRIMSMYSASDVQDTTRQPIWFRWDCGIRLIFDYRV